MRLYDSFNAFMVDRFNPIPIWNVIEKYVEMILFTVVKFIHMMTEFFPVRTEVTINYQSAVFLPISDACAAEMKAPRTSSPRSRAHPSAPNATARVGIFFSQVFTVPNGLSQLGFTLQLRLAK